MADKKYYIRVPEALVEVPQEVYEAYYQMHRRAAFLEEKDGHHGKVAFSNLDTGDIVGEDMIPDTGSESVEDEAFRHILEDQLHKCIAKLPLPDQKLVRYIYFQGMSERQVSLITGVPSMTIHNRKVRILRKLKKMMGG